MAQCRDFIIRSLMKCDCQWEIRYFKKKNNNLSLIMYTICAVTWKILDIINVLVGSMLWIIRIFPHIQYNGLNVVNKAVTIVSKRAEMCRAEQKVRLQSKDIQNYPFLFTLSYRTLIDKVQNHVLNRVLIWHFSCWGRGKQSARKTQETNWNANTARGERSWGDTTWPKGSERRG